MFPLYSLSALWSGSTVPKVTTKIAHGKVEAHGHREVRGGRGERQMEKAIYSILPSKAGRRFS